MTNKWFTNWTLNSFTYPWNSEPITFEAGESKLLPEYLADHFAKHLTDKELHSRGLTAGDASRTELLKKCFVPPEGEALPSTGEQSSVLAEIEALNLTAPKKRGRPKKVEPEMEKFDGLNENEALRA
jgi:hypothetical protein